MNFRLSSTFLAKSLFFGFVVELAGDQVKVVAFPVGFRSFRLHDFIVALHLQVVVNCVLVRDNVVFSGDVQSLERVLFALKVRMERNLRERSALVSSLAAGSGAAACRCSK